MRLFWRWIEDCTPCARCCVRLSWPCTSPAFGAALATPVAATASASVSAPVRRRWMLIGRPRMGEGGERAR